MVLHEDVIMVAALEAGGAQEVGEAVAALVELAIVDRFARPRHDDRRLIGTNLRLQAWIHGRPPARGLEDVPRHCRARFMCPDEVEIAGKIARCRADGAYPPRHPRGTGDRPNDVEGELASATEHRSAGPS